MIDDEVNRNYNIWGLVEKNGVFWLGEMKGEWILVLDLWKGVYWKERIFGCDFKGDD